MRRSHFIAGASAMGLAGCTASGGTTGLGPLPPSVRSGHLADLRYGFAPVPVTGNGYDPAGDAAALILPGTDTTAHNPIPGVQVTGSYATDERYVMRVPDAWNGKLVVIGTPAFRSEFANDGIWQDFLLNKGYATACSNKGVPFNAIAEPIASSPNSNANFPIPFDLGTLETLRYSYRVGATYPNKKPINGWNDDFYALTLFAKSFLAANYTAPTRTYAVGTSNGGAQVRSLNEQHPEVIDGAVDWEGVYWSPSLSILDYMPVFLKWMPQYVASSFTDAASAAAIQAAGFPADIKSSVTGHPSLWFEYYANQASFYMDLTVFAYALLIDPNATSVLPSSGFLTPNGTNPMGLPGTPSAGMTGMATPAARQTYAPSAAGRTAISAFAHTGKISKPMISIAGTADMFVTAANNATPYLNAVKANGKGSIYWQYLVKNGTHVDTFANPTWGYGLQPQLNFGWAAFNQLVSIVESGATPAGAGTQQTVNLPTDIHSVARSVR